MDALPFENDPIYVLLTKMPSDIRDQIDVLSNEQWKLDRPIIIQKISQIIGIKPAQLELRLAEVKTKRQQQNKKTK